jgi:small subunit ribosomal protein S9
MTDDEKQPSEDVTPEDPGTDGSAAGPVAEEGTSSTPPADETSEAEQPQDDGPEAEEQPQDDGSEEEPAQDDAPAGEPADAPPAEQEEDPGAEETPAGGGDEVAEDADGGSKIDGAPADGGGSEAEQPAVKKKDVIPGADLEPIAVESSEARPLSAEERARKEAEEEERAQREAALAGDGDEESPASRAPAKMESGSRFQATGKRKRSIARVTLLPGDGKFEINGRGLEEFFPRPLHQTMVKQPLTTTGYETTVDVRIRVHGGGISGQAGAVRHGIARALTEIDPELRGELKRRGFLTRDARVKERR